jgi:hypothetical protein
MEEEEQETLIKSNGSRGSNTVLRRNERIQQKRFSFDYRRQKNGRIGLVAGWLPSAQVWLWTLMLKPNNLRCPPLHCGSDLCHHASCWRPAQFRDSQSAPGYNAQRMHLTLECLICFCVHDTSTRPRALMSVIPRCSAWSLP